jgi:two-component system heavy metal sensor histidine kinase CusS
MKLVNRLSSFFLAALAVLLIVNSIALYILARTYLYNRFDGQLESALHTLVAAVELEDDDVKFEESDHTVTLGSERGLDDIRWLVVNEAGKVVAESHNLRATPEPDLLAFAHGRGNAVGEWSVLQHKMAAVHPKPVFERSSLEHAALTVFAARRLADVQTTMRWLTLLLIVLPLVCWIAAAMAGRWFIGHAIAPIRAMARSASMIRPDDTTARLPIGTSQDELQELGHSFNKLLDELFTAYERQRHFAGDAAHQLRTPLTILQGQVEVLLRRPRTNDEYLATLQLVASEVTGMKQTVETLLFLARSEHDEVPADRQRIEFRDWLEKYLARWKTDPRWNDLQIEVGQGIAIETSPGLLAQLFDVLISNALKYSESGTPVTIRAEQHASELQFEIADRGTGIAADDLEVIFQPFYRTRHARQSGQPGTGLGLAIAARIAKVLGGTLRCESQPEAGSRFVGTLPLA